MTLRIAGPCFIYMIIKMLLLATGAISWICIGILAAMYIAVVITERLFKEEDHESDTGRN